MATGGKKGTYNPAAQAGRVINKGKGSGKGVNPKLKAAADKKKADAAAKVSTVVRPKDHYSSKPTAKNGGAVRETLLNKFLMGGETGERTNKQKARFVKRADNQQKRQEKRASNKKARQDKRKGTIMFNASTSGLK